MGNGEGGAMEVGVGIGVFWDEESVDALGREGFLIVGTSPV